MTRILYGLEESEQLHDDIDDLIKEYVDEEWPILPKTLKVWHYEPLKVEEYLSSFPWFDRLLEAMDEELAYDGAAAYEPSLRLLEARVAFNRVLIEEYVVTNCERNGQFTEIDMLVWLYDYVIWEG